MAVTKKDAKAGEERYLHCLSHFEFAFFNSM